MPLKIGIGVKNDGTAYRCGSPERDGERGLGKLEYKRSVHHEPGGQSPTELSTSGSGRGENTGSTARNQWAGESLRAFCNSFVNAAAGTGRLNR